MKKLNRAGTGDHLAQPAGLHENRLQRSRGRKTPVTAVQIVLRFAGRSRLLASAAPSGVVIVVRMWRSIALEAAVCRHDEQRERSQ